MQGCGSDKRKLEGPYGTVPESFVSALLDDRLGATLTSVFSLGETPSAIDAHDAVRNFVRRMSFRFATSVLGSCTITSEGDTGDQDKDVIWADAHAKIDCTSGDDKINADLTMKDENNLLKFPAAGMFISLAPSSASLGLSTGDRLTIQAEASEGELKISDTEASGSGDLR